MGLWLIFLKKKKNHFNRIYVQCLFVIFIFCHFKKLFLCRVALFFSSFFSEYYYCVLEFCNYGLETGRERRDVWVLGGYYHFAAGVKVVFGTINALPGFIKSGF